MREREQTLGCTEGEVGGPEDIVSYRMSTKTNRLLERGKSFRLFNVNICISFPGKLCRTVKKRGRRQRKGERMHKGHRGTTGMLHERSKKGYYLIMSHESGQYRR